MYYVFILIVVSDKSLGRFSIFHGKKDKTHKPETIEYSNSARAATMNFHFIESLTSIDMRYKNNKFQTNALNKH